MFFSKDISGFEIEFPKELIQSFILHLLQFENVHIKLQKENQQPNLELTKTLYYFADKLKELETIKKFHIDYKEKKVQRQKSIQTNAQKIQKNQFQSFVNVYQKYDQNLYLEEKKIKDAINTILSYEKSQLQIQDIEEKKEVYQILNQNFSEQFSVDFFRSQNSKLLMNIVGTIPNKHLLYFQRVLFRLTRDNNQRLFKQLDYQKNQEQRTFFIVTFFDYKDGKTLQSLNLWMQKFDVQCYSLQDYLEDIPASHQQVQDEYRSAIMYQQQIEEKINEQSQYFFGTTIYRKQKHEEITQYLHTKIGILKIKQYIKCSEYFYEMQLYIQKSDRENFFNLIRDFEIQQQQSIQTQQLNDQKNYPTIYTKNSFTLPFLYIDEIYTIPKYKEVNPAFFGTVFFPFMFGLMFGDMGHGLLLIIVATIMFQYKDLISDEIKQLRYFLMGLGIFSFYCGFIYNEFFGVPLLIQSSCYYKETLKRKSEDCTYKIGIDYIWFISTNENQFVNSFKMKTSIIFGVLHMILGLTMNLVNCLTFRKFIDFLFVTLPKIVFMISIFGYMCFCIIYKWMQNYQNDPERAPSIISLFINFIEPQKNYLIKSEQYQLQLQKKLLFIASISVLIMFLVKPTLIFVKSLFKQRNYRQNDYQDLSQNENEYSNLIDDNEEKHENNETEHIIEHFIECIEFLLGSISNTASYLRLWALSLAHTQLSTVFLQMLILVFMNKGIFFSFIGIILSFPMFLLTHIVVLMIMDFMECMLHALRLHWVEFQSKFVIGDGIKFTPLKILIQEFGQFLFYIYQLFLKTEKKLIFNYLFINIQFQLFMKTDNKLEKKFDRYNQPLSKTNEYCILFLRFCCNFNEALLSAELVQSFLKFLGISLFSSTLIWGIPPIIVIFLGPFLRKKMLNQRYNSFLYLMIFLSIFFFINSVGFVLLFNLESYSALQRGVSKQLLFLGGISFTSIDMTKFMYEDQIIPYMTQYLDRTRKKNFVFYGVLVEKIGRIFGAFVSCLYVLLKRTNFARFSQTFLTNIQFTYYIGICLNSLSVLIIFSIWPRNFQLIQKPIIYKPQNLFDYYFPGVQLIKKMQGASQFLLSRYFFSIGMYWFVCVTITQWISNKFMNDYPDTISNSAIQAVDVGTAWGSIGLTTFYALWGLGHLIVHPNKDSLMKYSHGFSRITNFISSIIYLGCYIMYIIDLKIIVLLLGISGITFDWILYEKVQNKLFSDPFLKDDTKKVQKYKLSQMLASVEFLSEITFYIIVPIILNIFSDRQQMLLFSVLHLFLCLTVPKKTKIEI